MKYIGTKEPDTSSKGNKGQIWVMQENGTFKCLQTGLILPKRLIDSDVRNGYLMKLD